MFFPSTLIERCQELQDIKEKTQLIFRHHQLFYFDLSNLYHFQGLRRHIKRYNKELSFYVKVVDLTIIHY